MTDVDDLVRAQEALRIREAELRLFMDAVPALIAYVDTHEGLLPPGQQKLRTLVRPFPRGNPGASYA